MKQLNFAKFRKQMKGLRKSTANVQVVGFTEDDTHEEVVSKGARGLDINCDISELLLVCSNGIVRDVPIFDKQWTLGAFTEQNGGSSNRSKKVWGLLCPVEDENLHTSDSVHLLLCVAIIIIATIKQHHTITGFCE